MDTDQRGVALQGERRPAVRPVSTGAELEPPADFEPKVSFRGTVLAGVAAIGIGFGGFVGWAATAELDSAAVAYGSAIVDTQRKAVSHFEGGTLRRLLVAEGDAVAAGQPLMEIDDTDARAERARLEGERTGLIAALARLHAQQSDADEMATPPELADAGAFAGQVLADERRLFSQQAEIHRGKLAAQEKRIAQFAAEVEALDAQVAAAEERERIVADRLEKLRSLADKGVATEREVDELAATWAALAGEVGSTRAERAKAEQGKAEAEVALLSIRSEWYGEIAAAIAEAQLRLNDVNQRIATAEDILNRRVVRAPEAGTVMGIEVRTEGSAIGAGQKLMEIVPAGEPLLIEARIPVRDIDAVAVGAPARIRLSAYNYRALPPLAGSIVYVAPDQQRDPDTGAAYFIIRADIDPAALAARPDVAVQPGMPAEVIVRNRPRTALTYLLDPITDSFNRAFRED